MADNIATTLWAAMNRAVEDSMDQIAKEGLTALKQVLDDAGLPNSEFLKNYQVFAHVYGDTVEFEIVLDEDAVVPADKVAEKDIEAAKKEAAAEKKAEQKLKERARTYGWGGHGPRRLTSKNRPAKDARKPARDARKPIRTGKKTEEIRTIEHEVALRMPRSARVTSEGKLSISTRRTIQKTKTGVQLPQGDYQGIIAGFMDQLVKVLDNVFVPKLGEIMTRYAGQ